MTAQNVQLSPPSLPRLKSGLRLPTSLRWVLVFAFILLSIIPVIAALSVTIIRTSTQAEEQVAAQMNSVLQLKIVALEADLESAQSTLGVIARNQASRAAMLDLLDSAGAEAALQAQVAQNLTDFLDTETTDFTEYFVYNFDGVVLTSTSELQVGKIIRAQPYFAASLQGEYIQPPYYEIGSDTLGVIIAEPLLDAFGTQVGVLAGRLNMQGLASVMAERAGLGETGESYLVSPENNYLVTPSRFEGYPLNNTYHSTAIDEVLAGKSGSGQYVSYRGKNVIGAYQWLPELQVGVIAEYERTEALAASREATLFSIGVAVLAASLALMTGLIIAVRITNPIVELTQITQQFAEGDLTVRTKSNPSNEVGTLGTAFNKMADELQETLKSLEASVKEARTATAMAREANRLKSEFLSTMSHELRTPLNAIIGFTEIMMAGMTGEMNEKQIHKLSRVHLNSKRLLDLINDLLDLAKIEAGRVEVLREPFSPRDLAASIQAQTESLAEKRGLDYNIYVDPALPTVLVGDSARIEQVAKNLISNAVKFTPNGQVELRFSANGGTTWHLSVSDTGIGIPAHALEYIFDEFRQVDGTSQRAYGGSGLGLAITRNLARIMGGDVRVSSTLGKGSLFTVTLPAIILETEPETIGVPA